MAAIVLSNAPNPTAYTFTSATTWQEIKLPPRSRVTVSFVAPGGYLAFASNGPVSAPETPTDGGAVGTHRQILAADALISFRAPADMSHPSGQSIFLASQSATPAATITLEPLES